MALADWDMAVAYADTGNLMTTTSITKSGWGVSASEMKAAVLLGTWSDTIDTETASLSFGIGATDGTTEGYASMACQTGTDSPTVRGRTGKCFGLVDVAATTMDMEAGFNAWVDNGIEIDVTQAGSAARPIGALLMAGALDVDLRRITFADDPLESAGGVDIGFTPDFVLVFGPIGIAIDDSANAFNLMSIGCMSQFDGADEQCCVAYAHEPATVTPTPQRMQSYIANNRVAVVLQGDAVIESVTGGIQTDGYFLDAASGNIECLVLAVRGQTKRIDARCRVSPTGPTNTDDVIIRGGAVSPILRLLGGAWVTAANTIRTNRFAGSYGFGFHTAADAFYAGIRASESGGTSTETKSSSYAQPMFQTAYGTLGTPGATNTVQATVPSGGVFPRYDREVLDWSSFAAAQMAVMMDVTIGKGPATIVRGGRVYGGRIY